MTGVGSSSTGVGSSTGAGGIGQAVGVAVAVAVVHAVGHAVAVGVRVQRVAAVAPLRPRWRCRRRRSRRRRRCDRRRWCRWPARRSRCGTPVSAVMPVSVLVVLASLTPGWCRTWLSTAFGIVSPSSSLSRSGCVNVAWRVVYESFSPFSGVDVTSLGRRRAGIVDALSRRSVSTSRCRRWLVADVPPPLTDDHGHGGAAAGAATREADGVSGVALPVPVSPVPRLDVGLVARFCVGRLGHRQRRRGDVALRARTSSPSSRPAARRARPGRGFQRRGRWRSCPRGAGLRARRAAVHCAWCQCPTLVSIPFRGEVSASCTRSISPIGRN